MFHWFRCRVCEEKDKRIQDLKEQIQAYRLTLNPPPRINKYELEETAVMNGGGQEIDPSTLYAEEILNEESQREVDFIFSGNTLEVDPPENPEAPALN